MRRRSFDFAAFISAALASGVLLLGLASCLAAPFDFRISLTRSWHVGISNARRTGDLGRVEFFNDAEYGPYRGSIIALVDANGKTSPLLDRRIGFGEAWGVYYRYFRYKDGNVLWTLSVSPWHLLLLSAALLIAWFWRRRTQLPAADRR